MDHSSRRDFLKTTTGILGLTFLNAPAFKKKNPLLSFSTLGCPDWTFQTIVNFAAAHDYQGIEIRGIKRELDLTKCPEFNSPQNILASYRLFKAKRLKIFEPGSSRAPP